MRVRTESLKFPAVVGAARMMGRLDAKREIRKDLVAIAMDCCSQPGNNDFEKKILTASCLEGVS